MTTSVNLTNSPPPSEYDQRWMFDFWSKVKGNISNIVVNITNPTVNLTVTSDLTISSNTGILYINNVTISANLTINGAVGVF